MTTLLALDIGGTKVGWGIVEGKERSHEDPYEKSGV